MPITIGSNIASMQTQRRLGQATSAQSTAFERLSSGMRINRASDDAAGLSVATTLQSQSRVFGQSVRNVNDGMSLLAIRQGAANELSMLRLRRACISGMGTARSPRKPPSRTRCSLVKSRTTRLESMI